ncbi:hypothetical protein BV898_09912 [Hypsibius exemplaris]|uniref:Uncharacterized protein n=1 Tax=Hypsibius exemplaris TaxID=2072580 RepID=A0A1W0WLE1_HYPEX|nr:hypothetical protein BV898_09912 [Hypsibius exemplaris]
MILPNQPRTLPLHHTSAAHCIVPATLDPKRPFEKLEWHIHNHRPLLSSFFSGSQPETSAPQYFVTSLGRYSSLTSGSSSNTHPTNTMLPSICLSRNHHQFYGVWYKRDFDFVAALQCSVNFNGTAATGVLDTGIGIYLVSREFVDRPGSLQYSGRGPNVSKADGV